MSPRALTKVCGDERGGGDGGDAGHVRGRDHSLHKRRNVVDHLPESERAWVDKKLAAIFADPNPDRAEQAALDLAKALQRKHPGAAASLREGLPEMFTITRLGITGALARTLKSSNPIESMISVARTVNRNVTRWRDGVMIMRWTAAGMAQASRSFPRVKGYRQMPILVAALAKATQGDGNAIQPVATHVA